MYLVLSTEMIKVNSPPLKDSRDNVEKPTVNCYCTLSKQVLNESEEPKDMRHRVEHLGLCTVDDIVRSAKLNLALSFFVCHLYFYAKSYTEHIFGAERTNRWTPLSEATKHGLRWSIHQDHATFPGPLCRLPISRPLWLARTEMTKTLFMDQSTACLFTRLWRRLLLTPLGRYIRMIS